LLHGWGWQYGRRFKSHRKFGEASLRTTGPQRYGHAQGELRGVSHVGLGVKDGRRYWGTNDLALTVREGKAQYSHRQHIEETFRLLKPEFGWGRCSWRKQQAHWAHGHLGLYALVLTQQKASAEGQSIYALRQSLFPHSIPQNPLALPEFAHAA
jgi:hypothetical protein